MQPYDDAKIQRQLWHAAFRCQNKSRGRICVQLSMVFSCLEREDMAGARRTFDKLHATARKNLGWKGDFQALPRPFDKPYLADLYWQAARALGFDGPPRRTGTGEWRKKRLFETFDYKGRG